MPGWGSDISHETSLFDKFVDDIDSDEHTYSSESPCTERSPNNSSTHSSSATGTVNGSFFKESETKTVQKCHDIKSFSLSETAKKLDISLEFSPRIWDRCGLLRRSGHRKQYKCVECFHSSSYIQEIMEHYHKVHPQRAFLMELNYCKTMLGAPFLKLSNEFAITSHGPTVNCRFRQNRKMRRLNKYAK